MRDSPIGGTTALAAAIRSGNKRRVDTIYDNDTEASKVRFSFETVNEPACLARLTVCLFNWRTIYGGSYLLAEFPLKLCSSGSYSMLGPGSRSVFFFNKDSQGCTCTAVNSALPIRMAV